MSGVLQHLIFFNFRWLFLTLLDEKSYGLYLNKISERLIEKVQQGLSLQIHAILSQICLQCPNQAIQKNVSAIFESNNHRQKNSSTTVTHSMYKKPISGKIGSFSIKGEKLRENIYISLLFFILLPNLSIWSNNLRGRLSSEKTLEA